MWKVIRILFVAIVLFVIFSFNFIAGDLRYNFGSWTIKHWNIVPVTLYFNEACALPKSGGFPCGSSGATAYTLTGPTSGLINTATSNYTVKGNGSTTALITPADSSSGGIFNPTTVNLSNINPVSFNYIPLKAGSISVSTTNGGALTNPPPITLTVPNILTNYPGFVGGWLTNDVTLTTGVIGDPFGGANAATIIEDNLSASHFTFLVGLTLVANQSYLHSVMVKTGSGTRNVILTSCDSSFSSCLDGVFNPATCSFVSDQSHGNGGITSHNTRTLSGGWCLIQIQGSLGNFTGALVAVSLAQGNTNTYTGDGTSSLNIYGAVLE